MSSIYKHKPARWDLKKCKRLVKRKRKDAYGTEDHLQGFLSEEFGIKKYNGGCIREGKLYNGEYFPFPELADGFEIVYEPTWFYRIIEK